MKIVLAGGTGFIGRVLLRELSDKEHEVILLTKHLSTAEHLENKFIKVVWWDRKTVGDWVKHIDSADAVINLCGENVANGRWTEEQKKILIKSRIDSTRAIVEAISKAGSKPKIFINASAAGFYGHVENEEVDESHVRGQGFLADICEKWESIAKRAEDYELRVVLLRIGVVLDKSGGALKKMLPPFMMFAGGPPGNGKQWVSWIHRDDVAGAIMFALEHPEIRGPINITAPNIVTMKDFCKAVGKAVHRPSWAPVPAFALKIMLGDMSELLLTGQKAIPKKLQEAGYKFKYEKVEDALQAALNH